MKKKSKPRTKQKSKRTSAPTKPRPAVFSGSATPSTAVSPPVVKPVLDEREQREQAQRARNTAFLAPRARRVIAAAKVEDDMEALAAKRSEHEPMIGEAIWHVHGTNNNN